MNDPTGSKKPVNRMIWLLGLVALFALFAFIFAKPLRETGSDPATEPTPQSTEWTLEPTDPAVPVTLPTTPMTNVPDDTGDEARQAEKK